MYNEDEGRRASFFLTKLREQVLARTIALVNPLQEHTNHLLITHTLNSEMNLIEGMDLDTPKASTKGSNPRVLFSPKRSSLCQGEESSFYRFFGRLH